MNDNITTVMYLSSALPYKHDVVVIPVQVRSSFRGYRVQCKNEDKLERFTSDL